MQILWTDYPAFLLSLVSIVAWVVYLAWAVDWRGSGPVIPAATMPIYLGVAILITLVGAGVIIWRVYMIHITFREGAEIKGRITEVTMRRDKGRVEYTYIFEHEEYKTGAGIHRNKQTLKLKEGERIVLMVDRKHPKRAFIRDIYI